MNSSEEQDNKNADRVVPHVAESVPHVAGNESPCVAGGEGQTADAQGNMGADRVVPHVAETVPHVAGGEAETAQERADTVQERPNAAQERPGTAQERADTEYQDAPIPSHPNGPTAVPDADVLRPEGSIKAGIERVQEETHGRPHKKEILREEQGYEERAPWHTLLTPLLGKSVRGASRIARHGGSAFPGKVVEKFDPTFLRRTLAKMPLGVVLVSGTNGKTTTTRMVASMLSSLGLKVFTNPTGSNFTRGVVSALVQEISLTSKIDADIAVLELDEAYAVKFVEQVKPKYALLLNVMRDQLDRFGEIDTTARLLSEVAKVTRSAVVLNREDPRIAALAELAPAGTRTQFFGLAKPLREFFPSDDDMETTLQAQSKVDSENAPTAQSAERDAEEGAPEGRADEVPADVELTAFGNRHATLTVDGRQVETDVKLEGVYNLYNAAAALSVVRAVQQDVRAPGFITHAARHLGHKRAPGFEQRATAFAQAPTSQLVRALAQVTPAFGRGETIEVGGVPVELLLVKNPMGFRLSLASFPPDGCDTMIAINDEYADGRDMSWLWDVDFVGLREAGVKMVSGVRAWDMALRLEYDQVPVQDVDTDLESALDSFLKADPQAPKHIYCTYTAMLKVRSLLGKYADVADAGVGK